MLSPPSDASPGRLNAAPRAPQAPGIILADRPLARPLAPVTLALVAGIAAPAWGLRLPETWLLAGLAALWAVMALLWWQGRPARFLPLLFFGLLGVAFYQQAWQPVFPAQHLARLPENQDLTLWGRLNRPGKLTGERVQLFMAPEAWRSPWGWRPVMGDLLVLAPAPEIPPVGAGLVVRGRLAPPRMLQNPGTFNRPRRLAADGIFREVRRPTPERLFWLASTENYPLGERLRGGIRRVLQGMDQECRAIYLALLLGDQGEVTRKMRQNLARTGTSHLIVINGLHLGMVAAVTYFLSFWFLRCFPWLLLRVNAVKIATLLAAVPVVFYAWVAGGSPSTQRAEVMVLAYLLLVFLGRPGEVWSALALAALVILSWTPLRLFSISLQLSFVAVAFIIYLVPRLAPEQRSRDPADAIPGNPHLRGPMGKVVFLTKEWLMASVAATLATAPLAALYFQVVSLLGILVNLLAIPLVLLLALPLGEAAVFAQAASLTPLAQALLWLGKIPLWLGYQIIKRGAQVPGSAIIMPAPAWLEICAYYVMLILVFWPRRTYLTWAGAGLAAMVLAAAAALPLVTAPRTLEVTCLDSYGGLKTVVVTPENRRLVVSADAPLKWGRAGPGWGPLPEYCHWRRFRRLDLVVALNLGEAEAGELLTLARQFRVGAFRCGRRGREGPDYWDFWNFLGDQGAVPRPLERGRPALTLGPADLKCVKLETDAPPALEVAGQGRRVLLIPPAAGLTAEDLPVASGPLEAVVLPAELAVPRNRPLIMERLQPRRLIVYGDPGRAGAARTIWTIPCHFTRQGAVSLFLEAAGVTVRQWRP